MRSLSYALALGALLLSGTALAAPGDVHRVSAERVNLRAGPTDIATVRSQVARGEQLLELRRDGNWYGVRVIRTGEEGWIFGDLIEEVQTSTLGAEGWASAGFGDLSRDFDRMMSLVNQRFGLATVQRVEQRANNEGLAVTMTPEWLRAGSDREHVLTALAVYQMWKNHQNNAPVRVVMLTPDGRPYVTIDERQTREPIVSMAIR